MRPIIPILALLTTLVILAGPAAAASPEQEQAFIAAYQQAFAAKDGAALKALLHTEGADPMGLEFYEMMMTSDFGGRITVELKELTPVDEARAGELMPLPDGSGVRLAPKPYKKLVVTIVVDTPENKSTSTNEIFVADEGDRILISTPAPAK